MTPEIKSVELTGDSLTIDEVVAVARHGATVKPLSEMIRERVDTIVRDRQITPDIEVLAKLIAEGEMAKAIARETGLEYE
jgi:histidine ammonia-lyase